MKTKGIILTLTLLLFVIIGASAQCTSQLNTVSYDSTVSGSGNDSYAFTFPKFDPTKGTLTQVDVEAVVTLIYNFQLENNGFTPILNYKVRLTREDEISSNALLSPLTNSLQQSYGPFNLLASNGILGAGLDFLTRGPLYALNQKSIKNTVYNTADFMGAGTVNFDYLSNSFASLLGSAAVTYAGNVQDEVRFKITYHYCPAVLLANDITNFTANRRTDGIIDLKWITQNEKTNRKYELQKSTDGRVYRSVAEFIGKASTSETGSYSYPYQVQPDDNNKTILFRVKLVEDDGKAKYSAARAVKITAADNQQPALYPNPAKGATTLLFNNNKRGNWDVEVINLSGQVVKRYTFNNVLLAKLNTANELQTGLYMVRSTDRQTNEQFVQRLLIQ